MDEEVTVARTPLCQLDFLAFEVFPAARRLAMAAILSFAPRSSMA